jgi:hypothetical protein
MAEMKLKIVNSVVWPVVAHIPLDGGKTEEHKFFAKFNRLAEEKTEALSFQGDIPLLSELVVSAGEEQDTLSASKKMLNQMFSTEYYRTALFRSYRDMKEGAFAKN